MSYIRGWLQVTLLLYARHAIVIVKEMAPGVPLPGSEQAPVAKRPRTSQDDTIPGSQGRSPPPSAMKVSRDMTTVDVPHLMKMYYERLFPHQDFYKWLAYGNDGKHPQGDSTYFSRREFCFTLQGDVFVRYQSFQDGMALAAALRAKLPSKIDIGPLYSRDPAQKKLFEGSGQFYPVARELVFDIDLTDYDDVRTCGSGAHVCSRCWPLMAAAIQVVDHGLKQDFGFRHVLWVFSGRRGVHCWVCDSRARKMTDEQRSAVAAYFALYAGQEKGLAKLFLRDVNHPFVTQAFETLSSVWVETILPQQQLFEDADQLQKVLRYIPCDTTRDEAAAKMQLATKHARDGSLWADQWTALHLVCQQAGREGKKDSLSEKKLKSDIRLAPMRIVLAYTSPRLDIEVSKKMNHLLKAPFCVHPKTGKVCVPLDPAAALQFDVDTVPTVGSLLNELNALQLPPSERTAEQWRHTSLKPAMDQFQKLFLKDLCAANMKELSDAAKATANIMSF